MNAFRVRRVVEADLAALGKFECDNRQAFDVFNEPKPDAHYTPAGIARALGQFMNEEREGPVITLVVVQGDESCWLAKGCLCVHVSGRETLALLDYQTDQLHRRRGVATALVKELLREAQRLGVTKVAAHVAYDNLVSLHLLRRTGFQATGWAEPARLRRGTVDCLELSRLLRTVDSAGLARSHMHLSA